MTLEIESVRASSSQLRRLRAIDFRITFLGEASRRELGEHFNMGGASVTRDLTFYREELKGKIELDSRSKNYRPAADFKPLFQHEVESVLRILSKGFADDAGSGHSGALLPAAVPQAVSLPRLEILAKVSRAIHRKYPLRVIYHSFSSGAVERVVVPLAIADNGLRWHTRVYDRRRGIFIDLVLTRIESAEEMIDMPVGAQEQLQNDIHWNRVVELEIVPHPKESHPEIIRMDYPMGADGVLRLGVRAALASYLLRQWIVDCSSNSSLTGTEYRLWLRNTPVLYGIPSPKLAPGYDGQFALDPV